MKQIKKLVIFSLIVMIFANITLLAQATNSDNATATVNVHIPLMIDPIIPTNQVGNILPKIIYKNNTPTNVSGTSVVVPDPFAIFGINGDLNAPVTLDYDISMLHTTGMDFDGAWVLIYENSSGPTEVDLTNESGSYNCNLTGDSPSSLPGYDNSGGVSLYAYVWTITAYDGTGQNGEAAEGDNQLIFTVSAVYNY